MLPISPSTPLRVVPALDRVIAARALALALRNQDPPAPAPAIAAAEAATEAAQSALEALGEAAPVYLVKPASRRERIDFHAAMLEAGINYQDDGKMRAVLRDAVRGLADTEADALLAIVDGVDALASSGELVPDAMREQLRDIEEAAIAGWPAYARVIAARTRWHATAPLIAAQRFLVGWENVAAPFRRLGGVVPDETLDQIPDDDVRAIGQAALAAFGVSETERKNS